MLNDRNRIVFAGVALFLAFTAGTVEAAKGVKKVGKPNNIEQKSALRACKARF